MPTEFGLQNSAYVHFARWWDKKVWQNIFAILREDADFEEFYLNSTAVRAHQHTAGVAKYDKLACRFGSFVEFAASVLWLK